MLARWVLVAGPIALCGSEQFEDYVLADDKRVATLAADKAKIYCKSGSFTGDVDSAAAKQSLLASLGGQNVVYETLTKAASPGDVADTFMEEFGISWILSRSSVVVLAVLTLVFCFVFCLSSLCRCCAYERPTRDSLKNYLAVVILVVLVGLLFCTIKSLSGYSTLRSGLDNVQCTSVRLLDTLLSGEGGEGESFKGLLPILEEFQEAENSLDHRSELMQGVDQILQATDDIKKSVTLASQTLLLLTDMMHKNRWLQTAEGKDLLHECRFCKELSNMLASAMTALNDSPASKLAAARGEVTKAFDASNKDRFRAELRKSAEKLVNIKTSVVRMISKTLEEGGLLKHMKDEEDLIGAVTAGAVLIAALSAFLLGCCASTSAYRFKYHEMVPGRGAQVNPYNENIHKYAHTTWCCGFFHVFLTFLIAGLIFVLVLPFSNLCLVLDDLDSRMVHDMAPALGMNLGGATNSTGADAGSIPDIIDHCFHPTDGRLNNYFLDLLYTKHGNQRVTVKERINALAGDVQSRFSQITEHSGQPAPPLAASAEMRELGEALNFPRIGAMMTGAGMKLKRDDTFADMGIPKAGLLDVLESSITCDDLTLPAGMASTPGEVVPGISSLISKLTSLGIEEPGQADVCPREVTCKTGGFEEHACKAGNKYIRLKAEVRSRSTFYCDMFQAPGDANSFCDPLQMQSIRGEGEVTWSGDCLDEEGVMRRKQKACSLDEFILYIHKFEQRIHRVLQRLDDVMESEQPGIDFTMSMLIQRHILSRSNFIANGVTCKFFASYYQEFIDGFCYQGIYGLRSIAKSYMYCAIFAAMLVLSMYTVWCRAKGNIENWNPDRTAYNVLVDQEARRNAKHEESDNGPWILTNPNDARSQVTAPSVAGPPSTTVEDG